MFKATKKHVLLLVIFAFAFVYRTSLLLWQTYPPGSDIGFHAGVINSITQSGNTNFLWNFYQMGGGIELEFPGYHIFASEVIIMTGMPNYLAQAIIVALFSSLTALAAFLVTRIVWNESAAFIVAFLVTFSPSDIDIICWGGYPNIIVLFLIPLTFYLFLKRDKITQMPFLMSTSLLTASIFLTHSLSAAVFAGITMITLLVVLVFPRIFNESRKNILYWALPLFIGAILVSPFLASAAPTYLNESAIFTGSIAIEQALLANRTVPLEMVLALFTGIVAFFILSKKIKGRFFSLPVFLLIIWLLVPLLLTQGYLVGLYVDAVRFPFFLIYPVIILFAVMIDYPSRYFAEILGSHNSLKVQNKKTNRSLNKLRPQISARIEFKTIYAIFMVGFLLVLLFGLPIFRFPWDGFKVQSFYQVMDNEGYQAIDWAKQNTPVDSVFVSDMAFGWWLAGFGQRPTITNVDLQAITLAREVNISKSASYLLDTDYVIDNGYLQVREDGGYIGRHNPLITADVNWAYEPYPFIQFNNDEITLSYRNGESAQSTNLSQVPVTNMQLADAQTEKPSIVINKANSDISYSEILTVSKGLKFVNMTFVVRSNSETVTLDSLNFLVDTKGLFKPAENALAVLDEGNNAYTQLIFVKDQPKVSLIDSRYPCVIELAYNLQGKSIIDIQILAGLYKISTEEMNNQAHFNQPQSDNIQNAQTPSASLPITTFDYKKAFQEYNISYVVNQNFELNRKYFDDPKFSLAFSNDEFAIFEVEAKDTLVNG